MDEMGNEIKRTGLFEKLFYIILVPLFFVFILGTLLVFFLGDLVTSPALSFAQKIPFISNFVPDDIDEQTESNVEDVLRRELEAAKQQSAEYQREKEVLATEIQNAIHDQKILEAKIEELEQSLQAERMSAEERSNHLRQLASIYTNMTASRAASVLESLTLSEAALILAQMSSTEQAQIMGRMNPVVAAAVTVILKDQAKAADLDLLALQEQVELLQASLEAAEAETSGNTIVIEAFSQMAPGQAALILQDMEDRGQVEIGAVILAAVSTAVRTEILDQMDASSASIYVEALSEEAM